MPVADESTGWHLRRRRGRAGTEQIGLMLPFFLAAGDVEGLVLAIRRASLPAQEQVNGQNSAALRHYMQGNGGKSKNLVV